MSRSWDEVKADMDAITRARGDDPEKLDAEADKRINAYVAGYRLGALRKKVGLTQTELAERMGISQARISQLEKGDPRQFEVDTVWRYAAALGGDLTILVNLEGHHYSITDTTEEADEIYA